MKTFNYLLYFSNLDVHFYNTFEQIHFLHIVPSYLLQSYSSQDMVYIESLKGQNIRSRLDFKIVKKKVQPFFMKKQKSYGSYCFNSYLCYSFLSSLMVDLFFQYLIKEERKRVFFIIYNNSTKENLKINKIKDPWKFPKGKTH